MNSTLREQIRQLSAVEQAELLDELCDCVQQNSGALPLSDELMRILDDRSADSRTAPDRMISDEQMRRDIATLRAQFRAARQVKRPA